MAETRKRWCAPSLVVIARTSPDESVLEPCKTAGIQSGYQNANNGCYQVGGFDCNSPIPS